MPSSYRKYAVDYDDDGAIDLLGSPADAIGSIASYIKAFGWVPGEVPKAKVRLLPGSETDLVSGLERVHDIAEVQVQGRRVLRAEPPAGPCSIFELPTPGMPSKFVAGFTNFEVITRYNRSTFYASAVLELGGAIRKAHDQVQLASTRQNLALNCTPQICGSLRKPVRLLKSMAPTATTSSVMLRPNSAASYFPSLQL